LDNELPPSLAELRRQIELLMEYAAPAEKRAELAAVVDRYAADIVALKVFHGFYSYLPEAQDDGIVEIRRLANRQGVFLLCVTSLLDDYLYLATREEAEFLGPWREGIWDPEILAFFGWPDRETFLKQHGNRLDFPEHLPINQAADLCPVCGTADTEPHTLGCPVEVCPWCGGQLIHCQCRFDKTGRAELSREAHLDELLERLEEKGRVPFNAAEQRPTLKPE
jgi:hypothetical protein